MASTTAACFKADYVFAAHEWQWIPRGRSAIRGQPGSRLGDIVFTGALFVRGHRLPQGAARAARPASAGTLAVW
jgi:hypothetical protein